MRRDLTYEKVVSFMKTLYQTVTGEDASAFSIVWLLKFRIGTASSCIVALAIADL